MGKLSETAIVPPEPCEGALPTEQIVELHAQVPTWNILEREGIRQLERAFEFSDFAGALSFTNEVGRLAEELDHHPRITTEWGKVTVTWWTHKVGGLHRNDFISAAKVDEIYVTEQLSGVSQVS
jgi:4a-hydroxytetrahydrobiopterin dehydratase